MGYGHSHGTEEHAPGKAVHVLLLFIGIGILYLGFFLAELSGGNPNIFAVFACVGLILAVSMIKKSLRYFASLCKKGGFHLLLLFQRKKKL
ncbi:MAG: hypothetical protein AAB796_01590 [Patescibacteria group bacterium]